MPCNIRFEELLSYASAVKASYGAVRDGHWSMLVDGFDQDEEFVGVPYTTRWVGAQSRPATTLYAIRGTVDGKDVWEDAKMASSKAWNLVRGAVGVKKESSDSLAGMQAVTEVVGHARAELEGDRDRTVVLCGHSLGGAIALSVNQLLRGALRPDDYARVLVVTFAPYIQSPEMITPNACVFGIETDVVVRGVFRHPSVRHKVTLLRRAGSDDCSRFLDNHSIDCILDAIQATRAQQEGFSPGRVYAVEDEEGFGPNDDGPSTALVPPRPGRTRLTLAAIRGYKLLR